MGSARKIMHTADKGVYGCAVTWSCQSNINWNTEEKPLLFYWGAVTGSQESPHLELVKLGISHVPVPQSQPVAITVSMATRKV